MTTQSELHALIDAFYGVMSNAIRGPLHEMIEAWPAGQIQPSKAPHDLPVARWLKDAAALAPSQMQPFVERLLAARNSLNWQQTYSDADMGADFLERYGWSLLVGPDAPLHSDAILSGVLLFGPGVEYPIHQHAAEEVYVVLSGTASWKIGDAEWAILPPGSVVHNRPWIWHGMRMDQGEPLLLGFFWRSGTVEKSRLAGS